MYIKQLYKQKLNIVLCFLLLELNFSVLFHQLLVFSNKQYRSFVYVFAGIVLFFVD
jgi:hypothetical protein